MARRAQCLLWADSLLLLSPFTCTLLSLRPGHAVVLGRFVMAALHPVGNVQCHLLGGGLDPSSGGKRTENCSPAHQCRPCQVALRHKSRGASNWRHSLLQQKDEKWLFSSVHIPVLEGAQPALPWLRELRVPLLCFCFCGVLCEFFFGSCSCTLSLLLNWCFPAVSPDCLHLTAQQTAVRAGQDREKTKTTYQVGGKLCWALHRKPRQWAAVVNQHGQPIDLRNISAREVGM